MRGHRAVLRHKNLTFIPSEMVLIKMNIKMQYSKGWEVTNHQIRYWNLSFGMYLRAGLAFSANSMHFLYNKTREMKSIGVQLFYFSYRT